MLLGPRLWPVVVQRFVLVAGLAGVPRTLRVSGMQVWLR